LRATILAYMKEHPSKTKANCSNSQQRLNRQFR
jgi:hypothetical protein